ncbi:hypothetical protein DOTSEDRAFT_69602 [Dothistroma septosporum NZE10]|uniref:RING-type E3 ubiquitin transferase n=1 Tax=Dothistroma septosporum (strain NZE10 / CBS 128990) TaxID=675120 RepID=N1PW32_DOTSN|nr:hypothetical protein DOTSEDRAFT_69602 [Dothistroma septosporum NZE10]
MSTQTPQQAPQQRELVFCHQCENEWYRDEHGIICPDCQGDFTEIIEEDHDPREDDAMPELDPQFPGHGHEWYAPNAPDPDEADIDDLHWEENAPGGPPGGRLTGTLTRNIRLGGQGGQQGGQSGGGFMGMLGPILQGALGGVVNPTRQQGQGQGQERGAEGVEGQHPPGSSPGEQQRGNGGTYTRHAHGPGYSFTITTSTGGNLFPRDANNPQPFQQQPDNIERLMAQMFANIGAGPRIQGPGAGGPFMGMGMAGGPGPGEGGMAGGPTMFGDIFQLLGMAHGGAHGDAVYSQEALDRVITQLMEQHQSGNAPGPASSEAIENLPEKQISAKDLDENGEANCSICMDSAEIGSTVTELPCHHWFHYDCIKSWLIEHDTCPHCRQGIMPKDENARADRPRHSSQAPMHDMHSPDYHRAPSMPGGHPFPRQNSSGAEGSGRGSASQDDPFRVSVSPERSRNGGAAGGLFGRMRQAFSPGGSSSNPDDVDSQGTGGYGGSLDSGNR